MSVMTFRHLTHRHRILRRALLSAAYVGVALAGIVTITLTPRTIAGALGEWITYAGAMMAIIGGPAGAWAVATDRPGRDRWRVERWAAPLAVGGAVGYGVGVWTLILTDTYTRATQGAWILVVVLLLADRAVEVDAAAARDRALHTLLADPPPDTTERG